MRVHLRFLVLLIVGLAAGCGKAPQTPEAAVPVARAFMDARVRRDANALQELLTARARKAIDRPTLAGWVRTESVQYEGLGAPITKDPNWVQVPVRNLVLRRGEDEVRWPEVRLTLQYDGSNWHVGWADPLMSRAMQAFQQGNYAQELDLGRSITEIDPYHYRGYLEQHFAYRRLMRFREAELWLSWSRDAALDAQLPDVEDAVARFKLELAHPADAADAARRALGTATPYLPSTYSPRWQVDTMVVLGKALLKGGDLTGAEAVVKQALVIDPQNGTLAIFRYELTSPLSPSPDKPQQSP